MKKQVVAVIGSLVILGIILIIGALSYKSFKGKEVVLSRKEAIKKGAQSVFKPCADVSTFESRRACFKEQMTALRKQNPQVRTKYQMLFENKETQVETEDLGDILLIKKPKLAFTRCSSNTFFFDWVGENVYISLENPLAKIECTTTDKKSIIFEPSDLSSEDKNLLKNEFGKSIE